MNLSKAILVSICILPLVTVSYAEDVNKQNIRIVETTRVSMNEAEPSSIQMNKDNEQMGEKPQAINDSNDVEIMKEQGIRWWPWGRKKGPCGATDCWPGGR